MTRDEQYMTEALSEAKLALSLGETPVGAVIVREGEIIARAYNTRESENNALHHAEILAIDRACKALHGWRLSECELFVTLEPCVMCAGAIINARLKRVVFGAFDARAGCTGSVCNLFEMPLGHKPILKSGVLSEECSELLSRFFESLR